MVFSCPICSERLDRVPGTHSTATGNDKGDINISSTPCGHIFHTFCIQKWLTGNIQTSKQCPCCRKAVPGCRTLPLFPDRYDTSLDDSVDATAGGGTASCDHSHFNNQLNNLKKSIEILREKASEADEMLAIERDVAKDFKEKYEKEKERSDSFMFKWKQAQSYKDYAEQQERECKAATEKLKQYQLIDAMVRNVQDDVKYELDRYTGPCNSNSLEKLLEIHHVIQGEYGSATKKLKEVQVKQETDRLEIARLRKKYNELKQAHEELQRVHSNNLNTSAVTGTTPRGNNIDINMMDTSRTPLLLQQTKRTQSGRVKTGDNVDDCCVDSDVLVMQPFNKKKSNLLKRGLNKPNSGTLTFSQTDKDEDEIYSISKKLKTNANKGPSLKLEKSGSTKLKNPVPSSFLNMKQQPSAATSSKSSSIGSQSKPKKNAHNETILVPDSDEEDLLDIPLRGNIPGLKIERRPTQSQGQPSRKFTFKMKP